MTSEKKDVVYILSLLFAFLFPIYSKLGTFIIVSLGVYTFWKVIFGNLEKRKWHARHFLFFMPILLFVLYGLGFLYSEHTSAFRPFMETKLSLLVLPLIYYFNPIKKNRKIGHILRAFAYGVGCAMVYSLGGAIADYLTNGSIHFFYEDLSSYLHAHPTYLSLYAGIAIMIMIYTIDFEKKTKYLWVDIGITILLCVFIFLLSARMSLLVNVFLGVFFIFKVYFKKIKLQYLIGFILSIALVIYFIFNNSSLIAHRFGDLVVKTEQGYRPNNIRLRIWQAGWQVVKSSPIMGVGSGDANPEIYLQYGKFGFEKALKHKFNYHNQYLQTWSATGILGLLFLMIIFLLPIFYIDNKWTPVLLFISLSFAIGGLAESFFERETGIVVFMFFYSLLLFKIDEDSYTKTRLE